MNPREIVDKATFNEDRNTRTSRESSKIPENPINYYDRPPSYRYFQKNAAMETVFESPAYMAGIAMCNTGNVYKYFHDDDIILNLLLKKMVSGLTRDQRMEFALIVEMIKSRKTYRKLS